MIMRDEAYSNVFFTFRLSRIALEVYYSNENIHLNGFRKRPTFLRDGKFIVVSSHLPTVFNKPLSNSNMLLCICCLASVR